MLKSSNQDTDTFFPIESHFELGSLSLMTNTLHLLALLNAAACKLQAIKHCSVVLFSIFS